MISPHEPAAAVPALFDFPSKIQVQTVDRCNYLCPMCPYPDTSPAGAQLPLEMFHRVIDEVRTAGRRVKLCLMLQNEPFLDRRFLELLEYAHRAEDAIASISTVTNGSALTEEQMDRLMTFDRFHLTISVNATDRERYQRIHGRDLWDRVHGRLAGWQGPRERVRVSFVLDRDSVAEARAFQDYWRGLGYATRLTPINSRAGQLDVGRVHEVEQEFGHCHYPVDTLNVLVDGSVILCCNDWRHEQRFGSLADQTIAEIWNGPALRRLREAAIAGRLRESPQCRGCDYPIRSSQRLRLEALVGEHAAGAAVPGAGFASHKAGLRFADGDASALVWKLDPERGTASVLVLSARAPLPSSVRLELPIGHHGAFNFGSLEPIWCPGTLRASPSWEGTTPAEIQLDRTAEEFRFFPWYCADWAMA